MMADDVHGTCRFFVAIVIQLNKICCIEEYISLLDHLSTIVVHAKPSPTQSGVPFPIDKVLNRLGIFN
jgi:hypothetical protein